MSDLITVTGLVATTPRHLVTSEGLPITSFRLASTQRRYDRTQEKWIDGDTNWFTITGFRQLATNLVGSVAKGDRVLVTGRLKIRDWENGERTGTTVEIDADAIGHDLSWGTASFTRTIAAAVATADEAPDASTEVPSEPGTDADAEAEAAEVVGAGAVAVPF
jgi:single-strand DNA-binding protein